MDEMHQKNLDREDTEFLCREVDGIRAVVRHRSARMRVPQRRADELNVVITQQGLARPFGSELAHEHHYLAKSLIGPAWREGLAEARVCVAPINLSLSRTLRGGSLVDAKL